jgi:hypothetical protein
MWWPCSNSNLVCMRWSRGLNYYVLFEQQKRPWEDIPAHGSRWYACNWRVRREEFPSAWLGYLQGMLPHKFQIRFTFSCYWPSITVYIYIYRYTHWLARNRLWDAIFFESRAPPISITITEIPSSSYRESHRKRKQQNPPYLYQARKATPWSPPGIPEVSRGTH